MEWKAAKIAANTTVRTNLDSSSATGSPPERSEISYGFNSNNLSQSVWNELQERLKKSTLIEDENETTFAFEPFPQVPIRQEVNRNNDLVPNGAVVLEMIDPEASFQQFLGKSLDLYGVNFSDDIVQRKEGTRELVHGWNRAMKESFGKRLQRLRREVPEFLSALNEFKTIFQTASIGREITDAKLFVELNTSLADMKTKFETGLTEIIRTIASDQTPISRTDFLNIINGFKTIDVSNVPVSQVLNPFVSSQGSISEVIGAQNIERHKIAVTLNLNACKEVQGSEVATMLENLERRIAYISMLLIEIPEAVEGRKPVNTGEDTDENQAKSYSPLEVQLKALLANLELLEGVPPRPDSEEAKASLEYKYFSNNDMWDPEKKIHELQKLALKYSKCNELVQQVRTKLSGGSAKHLRTAEMIGRMNYAERLQADLKSLLTLNTQSLVELKAAVQAHEEQLLAIKQRLRQNAEIIAPQK